jgi:hypothetical protein
VLPPSPTVAWSQSLDCSWSGHPGAGSTSGHVKTLKRAETADRISRSASAMRPRQRGVDLRSQHCAKYATVGFHTDGLGPRIARAKNNIDVAFERRHSRKKANRLESPEIAPGY